MSKTIVCSYSLKDDLGYMIELESVVKSKGVNRYDKKKAMLLLKEFKEENGYDMKRSYLKEYQELGNNIDKLAERIINE